MPALGEVVGGVLEGVGMRAPWGLGLAAAVALAVVSVPRAQPLAKQAIKGYLRLARRAREWAAEATEELLVHLLADVDVLLGAAHALVLDDGGGSLAVGLDVDGLAAHGVAVGLSAHHEVAESDDVVRVIGTSIVFTAKGARRSRAHGSRLSKRLISAATARSNMAGESMTVAMKKAAEKRAALSFTRVIS